MVDTVEKRAAVIGLGQPSVTVIVKSDSSVDPIDRAILLDTYSFTATAARGAWCVEAMEVYQAGAVPGAVEVGCK